MTEWAAAGAGVPVLRDGHVRGPAARGQRGVVSYGLVLNAAAVLLSAYGNVPSERAATIGMLFGAPVWAGWVDKASSRMSALLGKAGLDEAMLAALAAEKVLAADETPVNVLGTGAAPQPAAPGGEGEGEKDPEDGKGKAPPGAPHVLVVRTPDERLTCLQALASRRKGAVAGGIPAPFRGFLITDGYTGYQHMLPRLAGIQQCCAHVIRRCRTLRRCGRESWQATTSDPARGAPGGGGSPRPRRHRPGPAGPRRPAETLRQRRFRRYHPQPAARLARRQPPGYALGTWLRDYRDRSACSPATSPSTGRIMSESATRQPPSGIRPLRYALPGHPRPWCRIRSYLDFAAAHGSPRRRHQRRPRGKPWLPPLPASPDTTHGPREWTAKLVSVKVIFPPTESCQVPCKDLSWANCSPLLLHTSGGAGKSRCRTKSAAHVRTAAVITSVSSTNRHPRREICPGGLASPQMPASLAMATCPFFPFPGMNPGHLAIMHRTQRVA